MTSHTMLGAGWPAMEFDGLAGKIAALRPAVDAHITSERVARYLTAIADTPAPSTAASAMRAPVLRDLLRGDGVRGEKVRLEPNFQNTASTVMLTGTGSEHKPLWYFAHLDTISYLVQSLDDRRYPLTPFCYHLTENGSRPARAYRFDLRQGRYVVAAEGQIES